MAGKARIPAPPSLIDEVETAYISLLRTHFGSKDTSIGTSEGTGTPADDGPPPPLRDRLNLLKTITEFIALKHKLHPEDDDAPIDGMVGILRTTTQREARRAKAERNGGGTPAILHRADEPTFGGTSDDE